jgi:hypothetical protein
MKIITLLICCIFSLSVLAQRDLLMLKHHGQTMQSWTNGSYILFQFSSKQWIEGVIKKIQNDSLIIDQIQVRQVGNQFGLPTIDTVHFGILKLHINEIYGMPKKGSSSNLITDGSLFQLGSAAFILLNVANSLIKADPVFGSDNLPKLGIAAGFFVIGKILQNTHKSYLQLGTKYKLVTIQL